MAQIPGDRRVGLATRPLLLAAMLAALAVSLAPAASRASYVSIGTDLGAATLGPLTPGVNQGVNFMVAPGGTVTVSLNYTVNPADGTQNIGAVDFSIKLDTTKFTISNIREGALTSSAFGLNFNQLPNNQIGPQPTPIPNANAFLIGNESTFNGITIRAPGTPTSGSVLLFDLTPVPGATGSSNIDIQLNSTPTGPPFVGPKPTDVSDINTGANLITQPPTNAFDVGFDGTITIVGVPEPASLALLAFGAPAAFLLRRRLRRKDG